MTEAIRHAYRFLIQEIGCKAVFSNEAARRIAPTKRCALPCTRFYREHASIKPMRFANRAVHIHV
jgi:hypothetical protein